MKKMRRAHLWIGLIASILILMESFTGLIMNEPWLIGQTSFEGGRGNFQPGQFNQGQMDRGMQWNQGENQNNGQFQGRRQRFGENGNFMQGMRNRESQGIMGTIRGLHEGRIGNTNIKWLIDLAAIAMIFLTGTGIFLSIRVLQADRKRKKRMEDDLESIS